MGKKSQPETCKIKILGRLWTLIKKNPPHPSYDGLCCYDNRQILLAPAGLKTRRLELLAHELLHARFRELDEESVLEAGRLIGRMHRKVRNCGFRLKNLHPPVLSLSKASKKTKPSRKSTKSSIKKTSTSRPKNGSPSSKK